MNKHNMNVHPIGMKTYKIKFTIDQLRGSSIKFRMGTCKQSVLRSLRKEFAVSKIVDCQVA